MKKTTLLVAPFLVLVLAGCGANMLKSGETEDPAEDAVLALERKDPDTAIRLLETALGDDEGNPQYLSILATAYAQRGGIEPLQFAAKLSANNNSQESSGDASGGAAASSQTNGFAALYGVMPAATDQAIADLDKAVTILATEIAVDDRLPGDGFKLALYQTASVILRTKALDLNGDGTLTPDEILSLSSNSAAGILNQIAQAAVLLGAQGTDDKTIQKAAESVAKYQTQIDASPGATSEEKLKNYLAGVGQTPPAP